MGTLSEEEDMHSSYGGSTSSGVLPPCGYNKKKGKDTRSKLEAKQEKSRRKPNDYTLKEYYLYLKKATCFVAIFLEESQMTTP
eukprot:c24031_g7_i2 orf=177-425(+)